MDTYMKIASKERQNNYANELRSEIQRKEQLKQIEKMVDRKTYTDAINKGNGVMMPSMVTDDFQRKKT